MVYEAMPQKELDIIKSLTEPFKVIFDVGARDNTELVDLFPEAEIHMFEVNPTFAAQLKLATEGNRKVQVRPFGLGDEVGNFKYSHGRQCLEGGEEDATNATDAYPVSTLDGYTTFYQIQKIDFLKIDVEGYDYKVLRGGVKTIPNCRYIQFEHCRNTQQFHDLLEPLFFMEYVGHRNVLCTRKRGIIEQPTYPDL